MNFEKAPFTSSSTSRIGAVVAAFLLASGLSGCLASVVAETDVPMTTDVTADASIDPPRDDAASNLAGDAESRPAPECSEAVVLPGLGTYAGSTLGSQHRYPADRCGDGSGPAVLYALWLDRPTNVMVTYWAASGGTLRIGSDCTTIGSGACTTPVDPPAADVSDESTWPGIGGWYGPGFFFVVIETLGAASDYRVRLTAL